MRPQVRRKLFAAATGLLGCISYPAIKSIYPIKKEATIVDDYVDLPTATADLTKDVILPETIGSGTDVPIDISHWLLLSMLKSKNPTRRERALNELARQRRWNDAECIEIAQALNQQDTVKLARTVDADLRLFLRPPSVGFIEATLQSSKVEKLIKTILKDVSEKLDNCSSCTSFYTNLSIRVRPDSDILAMNDLNQVDKAMRIESRKRKKSVYNRDVIRLKAVLNNIICGEEQALSMAQSGMLIALLYFRYKYKDDLQVSSLLAQIMANLTANKSTRDYAFINGWIQALTEYSRSKHLEISLPAHKALANLDDEEIKKYGTYGNHIYLLAPIHRGQRRAAFDVVFVHGLVGSVFKTWRQGSIALDEHGNRFSSTNFAPTTELLPTQVDESSPVDPSSTLAMRTKCWPKDWLGKDVSDIRILAVDYPTALSNWRTDCDLNKDSLRQRALHVMKQMEAAKLGDRPIIWVAHSMGGLLVKQILVLCDEYRNKDSLNANNTTKKNISPADFQFMENVIKQTKGIVFFSVPHKGSNLDWIERRNLQKLLMLTTEVIELQKGSPVLVELHEKFLDFVKRQPDGVRFMTYAENAISSFGVNKVVQWRGLLVHEDSLHFEHGPIIRLNIDHAHTCKPHSKNAITYSKTLEFIRDLMPKSQKSLDEHWVSLISFLP